MKQKELAKLKSLAPSLEKECSGYEECSRLRSIAGPRGNPEATRPMNFAKSCFGSDLRNRIPNAPRVTLKTWETDSSNHLLKLTCCKQLEIWQRGDLNSRPWGYESGNVMPQTRS